LCLCLDPEARSLRESLGELPDQAEKGPFAGMQLFERRTYDMKGAAIGAGAVAGDLRVVLAGEGHGAPAAKASVEFSDQIQIEDVGICEAVQKNLRSRGYARGRFSVKRQKSVHAFRRMYAECMRDDCPPRT
jgi:hypothetical protein